MKFVVFFLKPLTLLDIVMIISLIVSANVKENCPFTYQFLSLF